MKRIVFISVIMLFAAVAAFAQDDGRRKVTRKERKALQARVDSMLHARADSAMLDSAFVLEADEVMFKRGYTAHVTSSTNFVSVCGDRAVVQVAFNVPWSGFNGMGGITVEGRSCYVGIRGRRTVVGAQHVSVARPHVGLDAPERGIFVGPLAAAISLHQALGVIYYTPNTAYVAGRTLSENHPCKSL